MKQPTTRQLINEVNKIERQMKEIDQLGKINPNKEYKRKPSKETRNKQTLRSLQTRASKMGINLPQLVGNNSSDKVHLQKQYLKAQLQIKLNSVNNQINARPIPKTIQVMGKRMKTDGMTQLEIINLKRQVNDYRKSLKAVEKEMREQGFDEELIDALMSGKERFKISSEQANDIFGSFDNLSLLQVNPNHHKLAKEFYDSLSNTLGSDLNPDNFFNRVSESINLKEKIKSIIDEFSSDAELEETLNILNKKVEGMSTTQQFIFGASYDIETLVKELEAYLKNHSNDYERSKGYIWNQIRKIDRIASTKSSFKFYN